MHEAERSFPSRFPAGDDQATPVSLTAGPARFLITVDTEEAFDWTKPFSRENRDTSHVHAVDRFQALCDDHGVKPVYLVDYPIMDDPAAAELFGNICESGRGHVGMHLHPWVNPPHVEIVSDRNSYSCNLPPELERAKMIALHEKIISAIGVRPEIYRAGRYGAGLVTAAVLQELGVRLDSSVRPLFDYQPQHGPDFSRGRLSPYWITPGQLAELPLTTQFCGHLRGFGRTLFPFRAPGNRRSGFLSRSGMLERVPFTPEGVPAQKAIRAIDQAIEADLPLLNFSFHSPSLMPGNTPYVRTEADLASHYDWWRRILAHLKNRGVQPVSLDKLLAEIFCPTQRRS